MRCLSTQKIHKYNKGFTLVELIIVIVLLGILSIGVTGFIRFGSEMFVDTKNRSDMVSTGRFIIERLNREIRSALPNSVIVQDDGTIQCIVYTPIITTANYLDIPTISENEEAANIFSVVKFDESKINIGIGSSYSAAVYPTSNAEVYGGLNDKIQFLGSITEIVTPTDPDKTNQRDITVENNIQFSTDSTTSRLYFINEKVSYCVLAENLKRFGGDNPFDDASPITFFNGNGVLMANNLSNGNPPFTLSEPTQFRHSTVLIRLVLEANQEEVTFNNEVHISNAP